MIGLAYILGTLVLVPGVPLTLMAGLTLGMGMGLLIVIVSATIGASLAFLISRYLARKKVSQLLESRKNLQAVDQAIKEEDWKAVVLLRLSPLIPFSLQNYFYGITQIRLSHYIPATLFGIFPGTLMYVYFGAAGKATLSGKTAEGADTALLEWSMFGLGLFATIVVTIFLTRKAKAKLREYGINDQSS